MTAIDNFTKTIRSKVRVALARVLQAAMTISPVYRLARFIASNAETAMILRVKKSVKNVIDHSDFQVMQGPFRGLSYRVYELSVASWQRLFGTYESEIHDSIENLRGNEYSVVINIGAADGYYAVGLARFFTASTVFAFEANEDHRNTCKELLQLNGVCDRITVKGACDLLQLADIVDSHECGFIFADCTGCELELLQPEQLPGLSHYDIIFELHDFESEGPTVSQVVTRRFEKTHFVEVINTRYRKPTSQIPFEDLDQFERRIVFDEWRKWSVGWVFLRSRKNLVTSALDPIDPRGDASKC